jgi:hypothetical protein
LDELPRLGDEALGPCAITRKPILAGGSPLFYRITIQQCGIDAQAVRERAGLALMLGGGRDGLVLSGVMGAHKPPVVIISESTINISAEGASEPIDLWRLLAAAAEAEGKVTT